MSKNKNVMYKQCELESEAKTWMAWIPSSLATVGKHILIDGWPNAIVKGVYSTTLSHEEVLAAIDAYLHQREASDI